MPNNTEMRAKSEWSLRVHHSSNKNLWFFLCRLPWQTNTRLLVRSFTAPKVKDLVCKVRPMQPGPVR
eukprot:6418714-Amphidinium_carterae.1